jgi:hypothetical protein
MKGNDYPHFLSRILPKSPAADAEILCLHAFSDRSYERDYTLSQEAPLYSRSFTVISYCENAMMIAHKQGMNQTGDKKIVFDLNWVHQVIIMGSDKWHNDFLISQGKAKVLGGENTKNVFMLTSDALSGALLGGKYSTNILDVSNVNSRHYSLYLGNVSSFDRTRYVRDYLAHKQPVSEEKQTSVCEINHLVISANETIEGQGDGYTFYVKPNTGYSMINV